MVAIGSHPNAEVRNAALESLFGVLEEIGSVLTPHMWALVLRGAVLPVFDNAGYVRGAKAASAEALDQDWLDTSCSAALAALAALYVHYFGAMAPRLLGEFFGVVSAFLCQSYYVSLAAYAADAFSKLLGECGPKFSREMWDAANTLIENFFLADVEHSTKVLSAALSNAVATNSGNGNGSGNSSCGSSNSGSMSSSLTSLPVVAVGEEFALSSPSNTTISQPPPQPPVAGTAGVAKRMALTERDIMRTAIKAFEEVILQNYDKFTSADIARILEALRACYDSTCKALDSEDSCNALDAAGALDPYAAKAADVLGFYLRLGFRAYAGATQEKDEKDIAGRVFPLCLAVLERRAVSSSVSRARCTSRQSGALLVLDSLLDLNDNKYDAQYPSFYKAFVSLVTDRSEDIRAAVAKHFSRIGTRLNFL